MERTRQNTLLCDFSDDKSQYASFLQKGEPYAAYMTGNEATLPRDGGKNQMTSFQQCPCNVQVLESDAPDVIYSPRIPKDSSGNECEACRTTQLPMPFFSQSQHGLQNGLPTTSQPGKTLAKYKPPLQPVPELEDFRNNAENTLKEQQGVENIISV